jgi:hypothetical protein
MPSIDEMSLMRACLGAGLSEAKALQVTAKEIISTSMLLLYELLAFILESLTAIDLLVSLGITPH